MQFSVVEGTKCEILEVINSALKNNWKLKGDLIYLGMRAVLRGERAVDKDLYAQALVKEESSEITLPDNVIVESDYRITTHVSALYREIRRLEEICNIQDEQITKLVNDVVRLKGE